MFRFNNHHQRATIRALLKLQLLNNRYKISSVVWLRVYPGIIGVYVMHCAKQDNLLM